MGEEKIEETIIRSIKIEEEVQGIREVEDIKEEEEVDRDNNIKDIRREITKKRINMNRERKKISKFQIKENPKNLQDMKQLIKRGNSREGVLDNKNTLIYLRAVISSLKPEDEVAVVPLPAVLTPINGTINLKPQTKISKKKSSTKNKSEGLLNTITGMIHLRLQRVSEITVDRESLGVVKDDE